MSSEKESLFRGLFLFARPQLLWVRFLWDMTEPILARHLYHCTYILVISKYAVGSSRPCFWHRNIVSTVSIKPRVACFRRTELTRVVPVGGGASLFLHVALCIFAFAENFLKVKRSSDIVWTESAEDIAIAFIHLLLLNDLIKCVFSAGPPRNMLHLVSHVPHLIKVLVIFGTICLLASL